MKNISLSIDEKDLDTLKFALLEFMETMDARGNAAFKEGRKLDCEGYMNEWTKADRLYRTISAQGKE